MGLGRWVGLCADLKVSAEIRSPSPRLPLCYLDCIASIHAGLALPKIK